MRAAPHLPWGAAKLWGLGPAVEVGAGDVVPGLAFPLAEIHFLQAGVWGSGDVVVGGDGVRDALAALGGAGPEGGEGEVAEGGGDAAVRRGLVGRGGCRDRRKMPGAIKGVGWRIRAIFMVGGRDRRRNFGARLNKPGRCPVFPARELLGRWGMGEETGQTRRGSLKCMAWAGGGVVWTVAGACPVPA